MIDNYIDVICEMIDVDRNIIKDIFQRMLNRGFNPVDIGVMILETYDDIKKENNI